MPTLLETAAELDKMLIEGWNDRTPIAIDNVKFEEPINEPYIATKFVPYVTENAQIANCKRVRTEGVHLINIRVPAGKGVGLAYSLAQQIKEIMDNKNPLPNMFTLPSVIQRIGDDENGWYNLTCEVPFISDDTN